jgi:hypothetical protein
LQICNALGSSPWPEAFLLLGSVKSQPSSFGWISHCTIWQIVGLIVYFTYIVLGG